MILEPDEVEYLNNRLKELEEVKQDREFIQIDEDFNNKEHLKMTFQDLIELNKETFDALETLYKLLIDKIGAKELYEED